ncbi:hypothetical protein Q765_18540 [Flavobacterium rivuli WB 3.3-2 = DSM 21788]|uniref:Lipoprotein n=1 Tax=Flavobacterium rivuli WB 3.3-2 = DSM 21788 TaxID=1121895 RepID=A0A0A2M0L5_9FLAO|nr:hypothetical protein [Flavobacterium rivuli]KGO85013.1 hypothetical protein Q765_18540 [Flavobacterium rivuli WB 3.3-2 = DSM 21788]
MKKLLLISLLATLLLCSCTQKMKEFEEEANQKFGDQHFKTAISLIELYKLRHGYYPASMDSLEFKGDWDEMAVNSTEYKKLNEGYELNLTNGWMGKPDSLQLKYPAGFWKGLGIRKSNLKVNFTKKISGSK